MRHPFQLQHGSAQGAFVKSASPRGGEAVFVTLAAANALTSVFGNSCPRERAALPAESVVVCKQPSRFPTRCARHAVMARFNAAAANGTGLWIDEREGSVVESAQVMDRGSQVDLKRKGRKGCSQRNAKRNP